MKHILITGGSDGLGEVAARKLKSAGHEVTILAKDEAKTKKVADEIGCRYVVADVSDADAVENAINQVGRIDILINNAGVWIQGPLDDNEPNRIKQAINVNAAGTIYCTRAVVDQMKQRKSDRIINVSSQSGLATKPERSVYTASKWALTGFTKSMQQELKPFGISVVGFYPGALNTNAIFEKAGNPRDMSKALSLDTAAGALVYICSLPDNVGIPELGIISLDY